MSSGGLGRAQFEHRVRERYRVAERGALPRYAVVRTQTPGWSTFDTIVARCWTERGARRAMARAIRREIQRAWFV